MDVVVYNKIQQEADRLARLIEQGGGGDQNPVAPDNDVIFIDYDGTIRYSYTKNDFLALNGFPPNPIHSGLVAQGWNWNFEDAREFVRAYGTLCIGQLYATDDERTRLYCTFSEYNKSFWLSLLGVANVNINWGDGSTEDVSINGLAYIPHTYSAAGNYVISFDVDASYVRVENSCLTIYNDPSNTCYLAASALKKIELGNRTVIGSSGFRYCINLESISTPDDYIVNSNNGPFMETKIRALIAPKSKTRWDSGGLLQAPQSVMAVAISKPDSTNRSVECGPNCKLVKTIIKTANITGGNYYCSNSGCVKLVVIEGVTVINNNAFRYNYWMQEIILPQSLITIMDSAFNSCKSLTHLTIPSNVTSIGSNCFIDMSNMKEFHFKSIVPPTLANSNAFNGIPSDCIIFVPYSTDHSILDAYKAATNWSTVASKIVEESL